MPKIKYASMKLGEEKLRIIKQANEIIADYTANGINLTLRGLYYQYVARDLFPQSWQDPKTGSVNNERSYKKLGTYISDGRMAGLIDWDSIVDRARTCRKLSHWSSPTQLVKACADQYRIDKWARQEVYCEVLVEKEALIGVIETVCEENDVPFLACKGYLSISEVWNAGYNRLRPHVRKHKQAVIFYLGDHDPSGIDMTADVQKRLSLFAGDGLHGVEVRRLALNMDQIEEYNPPPNPTKPTDSRCSGYRAKFGDECWELDALDPVIMRDLIAEAITEVRDQDLWDEAIAEENEVKAHLAGVADNWDDVVANLPSDEEG